MFENQIPQLIEKIQELKPRLILIDGPAGSGKTSLSELIAPANSQILHLDDFYNGWEEPFDDEFLIRVRQVLEAHSLQSDAEDFQTYDWEKRGWINQNSKAKTDVLILEGVGSFLLDDDMEATLKIFVTTDFLTGLNRVVSRDGDNSMPYIALWKQREFELFEKYDLPAVADFYLTT